jgi:hypothetical protein
MSLRVSSQQFWASSARSSRPISGKLSARIERTKAQIRLLWTKGLAQLLDVDGAYVATTDTRTSLRSISRKLGITFLDGADLRRIGDSTKVTAYAKRTSSPK